ncbi:hypothetical protein P879_03249 [Paragonimus westermani]|uniref:GPR180/TMEM145 transmembrane domain-containing protein n=1 Tax=Paragonimus westermani TaxID=34504 RepID=A0A8T0DNT5_9TREM|nr:hypothetical protein P879_03249 [Paragonimus westermani]
MELLALTRMEVLYQNSHSCPPTDLSSLKWRIQKLQAYWDSPVAWTDSFNMRLSCSKKQAILRRLSASQVIHLEPNSNSWCQKMPISNQVLQELSLNSYEDKADDWSVVFASILQKISGAAEAAREWLSPLGPPDNRMKMAPQMKPSVTNNVTQKEVPIAQPIHQKSRLPHVVRVAWETLAKSSDPESKNYMQNLIYCKSPTIPLRFTRPVWWFFMLERCQAEHTQSAIDSSKQSTLTSELGTPRRVTGLHAVYQLSLRNGIVGDLFHEHFSAQKFGSLEMDMVFLLFLLVLLCLAGVVANKLYGLHKLHPTALLWAGSIACRVLGQLVRLVSSFQLAISGWNNVVLSVTAQLLYSISMSALFACLLLLSSGYTTVHRTLTRAVAVALFVLLALYTLTNSSCLIAMEFMQYRGSVLSRYHSPAAYVFIGLQMLAWVGFALSTGYTVFNWSAKRLFLIRLMVIYSFWFWTVPFWTCITIELAKNQYTETMIRTWEEMVNLIVYALLLLLVQPKNANTVFPFHVQQAKSTSRETVIEPEPSPKPTKTQTPRPGTPIRAVHETAEAAKFKVKEIEQPKISKPASPTRPPIKLPAIGGKPGDLPPPGFSVTRNLAHLSTEAQLQKRPQTTPSMPTVQSRSDPKFSSTA